MRPWACEGLGEILLNTWKLVFQEIERTEKSKGLITHIVFLPETDRATHALKLYTSENMGRYPVPYIPEKIGLAQKRRKLVLRELLERVSREHPKSNRFAVQLYNLSFYENGRKYNGRLAIVFHERFS